MNRKFDLWSRVMRDGGSAGGGSSEYNAQEQANYANSMNNAVSSMYAGGYDARADSYGPDFSGRVEAVGTGGGVYTYQNGQIVAFDPSTTGQAWGQTSWNSSMGGQAPTFDAFGRPTQPQVQTAPVTPVTSAPLPDITTPVAPAQRQATPAPAQPQVAPPATQPQQTISTPGFRSGALDRPATDLADLSFLDGLLGEIETSLGTGYKGGAGLYGAYEGQVPPDEADRGSAYAGNTFSAPDRAVRDVFETALSPNPVGGNSTRDYFSGAGLEYANAGVDPMAASYGAALERANEGYSDFGGAAGWGLEMANFDPGTYNEPGPDGPPAGYDGGRTQYGDYQNGIAGNAPVETAASDYAPSFNDVALPDYPTSPPQFTDPLQDIPLPDITPVSFPTEWGPPVYGDQDFTMVSPSETPVYGDFDFTMVSPSEDPVYGDQDTSAGIGTKGVPSPSRTVKMTEQDLINAAKVLAAEGLVPLAERDRMNRLSLDERTRLSALAHMSTVTNRAALLGRSVTDILTQRNQFSPLNNTSLANLPRSPQVEQLLREILPDLPKFGMERQFTNFANPPLSSKSAREGWIDRMNPDLVIGDPASKFSHTFGNVMGRVPEYSINFTGQTFGRPNYEFVNNMNPSAAIAGPSPAPSSSRSASASQDGEVISGGSGIATLDGSTKSAGAQNQNSFGRTAAGIAGGVVGGIGGGALLGPIGGIIGGAAGRAIGQGIYDGWDTSRPGIFDNLGTGDPGYSNWNDIKGNYDTSDGSHSQFSGARAVQTATTAPAASATTSTTTPTTPDTTTPTTTRPNGSPSSWDDAAYQNQHPEVKQAIADGRWGNGYDFEEAFRKATGKSYAQAKADNDQQALAYAARLLNTSAGQPMAAPQRDIPEPYKSMGIQSLYGMGPMHNFFPNTTGRRVKYAKGGLVDGPGTETSDDVPAVIDGYQPAALSTGEFVFTGRAVRGAGGGNRMEGAKNLHKMMKKFESKAGK